MRTYRELFRVPEFGSLFAVVSVQVAAGTINSLALGTLVFSATGSALLSALSMFGSSFAQVIGAMTLLSISDRVPPRTAIVALAVIMGCAAILLAIPGLPLWGIFAIILATGLVNSVGGGVRYGLLGEILPDDAYVLGRSVFNMSVGAMQIAGFGLGGILVASGISPRLALLIGASLSFCAAVIARFGLTRRAPRATGRPSVHETLRVNRELWSVPARRSVYLSLWVPNGLIVGCEALFIPYAQDKAGVLFIAGALGMLAGDLTMGRFVPQRIRGRLIIPMRLLLAVPYLLFGLPLAFPLALIVVVVASAGFGAGLLLQERLLSLTPDQLRGQALGLHTSGMVAMQAVGATVAGAVATYLAPGHAMAVMATASILVTLALTPGLRRPLPSPVPALGS